MTWCLKIGPGPGTLTELLVHSAKDVVAVEFDAALAENLHSVVVANNLEVLHQDILAFDEKQMPSGYKVVANNPIPHNSQDFEQIRHF